MHKERERESLQLQLRRSSNPPIYESITPSTSPIYEPTNFTSTQSLQPTSLWLRQRPRAFAPRTDLRPRAFDSQAFDFTGNPEPSRHEPTNWSLSLSVILIFCMILIDQRTDLCFCVILIFYFLSLISDFFVVVGVVVFWWFSCCVVVGFVWVVVENNIFKILPNTWKYFLK